MEVCYTRPLARLGIEVGVTESGLLDGEQVRENDALLDHQ